MATYDINTQTIPSSLRSGDIINCPYSGTVKNLTLKSGIYKLETWGAQGGYRSSSSYGGNGGYSVGTIELSSETNLYLRTGGSGNTGGTAEGFNGGGSRTSYAGGGGGSDIRIGTDSLYARVIVAGGGGSCGASSKNGMYGGGTTGGTATQSWGSGGGGGTQTAGGANSGTFGQGGTGLYRSSGYGGAGGGGWYGGGGVYPDGSGDDDRGGGGGSGYVYNSANASNYPSGCLLNSSHYLSDAQTMAGNTSFTDPDSGSATTGRLGNGCIRITVISAGYTIVSSVQSGNGTITPLGETSVDSGSSQSYTITPNPNNVLSQIIIDGSVVWSGGQDTPYTYTFSNISEDHTISVVFLSKLIVTSSAGFGGIISPLGSQYVIPHNSITYTITPNDGYTISDVQLDGNSIGAVSTYTLSNIIANHVITAKFLRKCIVTTLIIGQGSVSPTGTQYVSFGGSIVFTITPQLGSQLTQILVEGVEQILPVGNEIVINGITNDTTITFIFSKAFYIGQNAVVSPYVGTMNIKKIYIGTNLIAKYNNVVYTWLLQDNDTPVLSKTYVWVDTETWNDDYYYLSED